MTNNPTAPALLELDSVSSGYDQGQVLFNVSLRVNSGEVVSLMGKNGMGKSTLIRTVMGQLSQRSGHIRFDSKPTRNMSMHKTASLGIGWVPEGRMIFPSLSVEENLIATASNRQGNANPWQLSDIYDMFPRLLERKRNGGSQLSGGEQQMLAIGRALMTNPKLLILDEATEGLAPKIRQEIWQTLAKIKTSGLSILVIDKDIKALSRLADRHYMLEKGQVVWEGDSKALQENKEVVKRYVGI